MWLPPASALASGGHRLRSRRRSPPAQASAREAALDRGRARRRRDRTRPDLRDRHWEPGLAADHRVLAGDLCGPGGDGAAGGRDRDRASDAAEHDWCRGRQRPRRGSARAPARRNCLSGNSVTSRGELGVAAIGADDHGRRTRGGRLTERQPAPRRTRHK